MQSISQEPADGTAKQETRSRKPRIEKAQAGLEMMAFVAFILLAFTVAYISLSSKTIAAMESGANEDARKISDRVASEINTAVAEGNGYSRTFWLPETIQGWNYTITVEQGTVFVDWRGDSSSASNIIVSNITGNFGQGSNMIENRGGVIFAS